MNLRAAASRSFKGPGGVVGLTGRNAVGRIFCHGGPPTEDGWGPADGQ